MAKALFALISYLGAGSIMIKRWRMQDAMYLTQQMSTFFIIVERTCVQKWIWYLVELGNSNWVLETKFWWTALFYLFFYQICHRDGWDAKHIHTNQPKGVTTHCLISRHYAINYTKAAIANFCVAVPFDKWNVRAATSEKLPSFFHGWILLTLMMCNSQRLHLTCALNGSMNCLPRVMKKKTANQAKNLKCVH